MPEKVNVTVNDGFDSTTWSHGMFDTGTARTAVAEINECPHRFAGIDYYRDPGLYGGLTVPIRTKRKGGSG